MIQNGAPGVGRADSVYRRKWACLVSLDARFRTGSVAPAKLANLDHLR